MLRLFPPAPPLPFLLPQNPILQLKVNDLTRKLGKKLFAAGSVGIDGWMFADLLEHEFVVCVFSPFPSFPSKSLLTLPTQPQRHPQVSPTRRNNCRSYESHPRLRSFLLRSRTQVHKFAQEGVEEDRTGSLGYSLCVYPFCRLSEGTYLALSTS